MKNNDRSIDLRRPEHLSNDNSRKGAIRIMELFNHKSRKICSTSLEKSCKEWIKIYAPKVSPGIANSKQNLIFRRYSKEEKEMPYKCQQYCNLNQSITECYKPKDMQQKELETQLSTAMHSSNQLESTINVINKYIYNIDQSDHKLKKINDAIESIVLPQIKEHIKTKESVHILEEQLKTQKLKNQDMSNSMKSQAQLIAKLKHRITQLEQSVDDLKSAQFSAHVNMIPKIPKLDLSKIVTPLRDRKRWVNVSDDKDQVSHTDSNNDN